MLKELNFSPPPSNDILYEERILSTPSHYAYLKISEGCNHTCAFCAIPLMRGKHHSKSIEMLVQEARELSRRGVKELIIISQDTTFYGLDLYGQQRLIDLLKELEAIEGIEWIRLHYLYPTTVQNELFELMAGSSKIVPYLDMPIQHISDRMLKIMKRGGTSRRIREIFELARKLIPDVILRTTLIVGHPGETENDFKVLKDFVGEMEFDRLGVFTYSHEENTAAYHLEDLPEEVKTERYNTIMELQQGISLKRNQSRIGKIMKVIIDEIDWSSLTAFGRTTGDSPEIDNEVVITNLSSALKVGEFVDVRIADATEYELYGEIEV
ncbi:MAG: 30S ribosomal protein S12 methylthiotransferase RimO [Methanobacteriota archaeon]|nr:MAG: 30S ribosomal protein S12 methylthiotransferase RimO [Euryarchaeota archaeon]